MGTFDVTMEMSPIKDLAFSGRTKESFVRSPLFYAADNINGEIRQNKFMFSIYNLVYCSFEICKVSVSIAIVWLTLTKRKIFNIPN